MSNKWADSGKFKGKVKNNGKVTLSEIARRAETSAMAVSVVLNGARSNTRVSDTTRQRILEIAADLNYTPNALAQSLKRQRANTIGILFTWAGPNALHNLYSVAVLDGIVASAGAAGYHILLYTSSWKNALVSSAAFSDRRADGVVVVAPLEQSDVISGLTALGLSVAVVSSIPEVGTVPFVDIDNARGATLALDHLRELGHTRIGFVGYGLDRRSMRERYETYCRWMRQHDLPIQEQWALTNLFPGNRECNTPILETVLRSENRPTALFAVTDDLAIEVMERANNLGIAVPERLSVVGFDDLLVASMTTPKLTTIRQPLFEMGKQAASLLIARIEGREEESSGPAHIFAPELIIRSSTAPPAVT